MQQAFLDSVQLHLIALEQALANSQEREEETRKQLNELIIRFKWLERMVSEQRNVPTLIPTILAGQPPPPTLPTEFDGERSRGQAFLNSVQTYMHLCSDSFHSDQVKITWTLSYMKSGRAAKWVAWVFRWEEENGGYSKFLDWDKFQMEFRKDFCPTHSDTAAINTLESTSYYQKTQGVDNYLDEFLELVLEAGYTDPRMVVVKFWKGLDPQIQNSIATMPYGRPLDTSPGDWYKVAKTIDQNWEANEAFQLASHPTPHPAPHSILISLVKTNPILSGDIPSCMYPFIYPIYHFATGVTKPNTRLLTVLTNTTSGCCL